MKFYFNFGKPYLKTTDQCLLFALADWSQSPQAYRNEEGYFQCSNPLLKPKYITFVDETIRKSFDRLQQYGYVEYYWNDEDYAKSQFGQATRWCRLTDKCADIIPDKDTDKDTGKDITKGTDKGTDKDTTKENHINHISYNQNSDIREQNDDDASSSPSSEQLSKYQPLYDKFKQVLGGEFFSIDIIYRYASPLIRREYTIQDLLDVIEYKGKIWNDDTHRSNINPKTLFKEDEGRFEMYLAESKAALYSPSRLAEIESEKKAAEEYREHEKLINSPEYKASQERRKKCEDFLNELLVKRSWNPNNRKGLVDKLYYNENKLSQDTIREIFDNAKDIFEVYDKL